MLKGEAGLGCTPTHHHPGQGDGLYLDCSFPSKVFPLIFSNHPLVKELGHSFYPSLQGFPVIESVCAPSPTGNCAAPHEAQTHPCIPFSTMAGVSSSHLIVGEISSIPESIVDATAWHLDLPHPAY